MRLPAGRWKKVLGRFKCERYPIRCVAINVAICQCCVAIDSKSTPLPKEGERVTFQRGAGRKLQESSNFKRPLRPAHRQGTCQNSSGALEESSRKVQNASTYCTLLNEEWMGVCRETSRAVTVSPSGRWTTDKAVRGAKARTHCPSSKKGACMPHEKRNGQSSGALDNRHAKKPFNSRLAVPTDALRAAIATDTLGVVLAVDTRSSCAPGKRGAQNPTRSHP